MSISSSKLLGDLTFHGIYFLFKRDLASPLPRFPRREKKILEDSRKSTINFHPGEEEKRNLISLFLIQLLRKILRFHPTSNYYQLNLGTNSLCNSNDRASSTARQVT